MTLDVEQKTSQLPILDLLRARHSPRIFARRPIPKMTLLRLFEAARWAPSSFNIQPWRFIYAHRDSTAFEHIYRCLSKFNQSWAGRAPVLMLAIIHKQRPDGEENYHALHDLGLAMGQFTVQAQSEGIAVHQMAGVNWGHAASLFGIPKTHHVVTAVALGYYGGDEETLPSDLQEAEGETNKRLPLSEIVSQGSWFEK